MKIDHPHTHTWPREGRLELLPSPAIPATNRHLCDSRDPVPRLPQTRIGMTSLASSPGQENRPPLEETAWRRFPAPSLIPVNMLDKSFRRPRTLLLGIPLGSLGGPPPPWPLGARPLGSAFTGSCRGSGPSSGAGSWERPGRPRTEATRRRAGAPAPVPASGASRPAPGRPPRPS